MDKQGVVQAILVKLRAEAEEIARSASALHEGAVHAESQAEDEYDTRGLETSYIADAQSRRAAEAEATITQWRSVKARDWPADAAVALGALIEAEDDGKDVWYLVGPTSGGMRVEHAGNTVTVVTPASPLGAALIGKRAGDLVEVPAGRTMREVEIRAVR